MAAAAVAVLFAAAPAAGANTTAVQHNKAVGSVIGDPNIAAGVSFDFLPMSCGGMCQPADDAEACALHAAACDTHHHTGGCTGAAAARMANFVACYEKDFHGPICKGAATQDAPCIASAGIDKAKYTQCRGDASLLKQIHSTIDATKFHGGPIAHLPTVAIAGTYCPGCFTQYNLKQTLCSAGVSAAC
eukprot:gene27654-65985_t